MRLLSVGIATAVLLLWSARPASAGPISFSPSATTVELGGTFSLDLLVSEVTDLYTFQFDVSFDPAVIQAVDILEGGFLGTGGSTFFIPGAIDNALGTISFTGNSLLGPVSGMSGGGILATLNFLALGAGSSTLALGNVLFLDSGFGTIDVTPVGGIVNVSDIAPTPVPEPSSLVLLGTALATVVVRARRRCHVFQWRQAEPVGAACCHFPSLANPQRTGL